MNSNHGKAEIVIQRAELADLIDMHAIDLAIGNNRAAYLAMQFNRGTGWLARRNGETVGFVLAHRQFWGFPFVELLIVLPAARRLGIAGALMGAAEAWAGPDRLFTSTNQSNLPMQRLCQARGYQPSGIVEHLDEGDPELIFVKWPDSGRNDRGFEPE